ncbi:MAG: hypothetical protein SNJ75_16830 [Gemmataceae bacterium]
MRKVWIALIGLVTGCHTLPQVTIQPQRGPLSLTTATAKKTNQTATVRLVPIERQTDISLPRGLVPASYSYFEADRSRVNEPVVRLPPSRRRQVELQLVSLRQAPVVFRLGGEMDHGYEHSWLVGRIHKHGENWRLRYERPGSTDRYDGCLELLMSGNKALLQEGMLLRVEGDVIDPAPFEIQPLYRVRSWKLLSP